MSSVRVANNFPKIERFAWLMGLYGENFRRLGDLVDINSLEQGTYRAFSAGKLPLTIEVIKRHKFMLELRLHYDFLDPQSGCYEPSVHIRAYLDSRQAEATHCYAGRDWQEQLGIRPATEVLLGHRMRMNTFLSKWLEYLIWQGYDCDFSTAERAPAD